MDIGQPKRIIEVEPVSLPLPEAIPAPGPAEPRAGARSPPSPLRRSTMTRSALDRSLPVETATEPRRSRGARGRSPAGATGRTSCCARSSAAAGRGCPDDPLRRGAGCSGRSTRRPSSRAPAVSTARTTSTVLRRTRCPAVIGRVALWGRVIEHELGYRARYGYPQRLRADLSVLLLAVGDARMPRRRSWAGSPRRAPARCVTSTPSWPCRYGMRAQAWLPSDAIDQRLRDTYAVDPLPR